MKKTATLLFLAFYTTIFSQNSFFTTNLTTLDNKSVTLEEVIKKENITVVSFWATWCVPCINELDAIAEVYDDWQEDINVEVIAVSIDDARGQKRVKPLVNGKGWDYKILLDKNQDLQRLLNISSIPFLVIIKDNKIVLKHSGYAPGIEEALYKKILKLSKK